MFIQKSFLLLTRMINGPPLTVCEKMKLSSTILSTNATNGWHYLWRQMDGEIHGLSVEVVFKPPKSPDLNVLDLDVWLEVRVDKLQRHKRKTAPTF